MGFQETNEASSGSMQAIPPDREAYCKAETPGRSGRTAPRYPSRPPNSAEARHNKDKSRSWLLHHLMPRPPHISSSANGCAGPVGLGLGRALRIASARMISALVVILIFCVDPSTT